MGSTAIPGLAAKPIIDLIAAIRDLDDVRAWVEPLQTLGYTYISKYEAEMPERRFFQKHDAEGRRTHHLHIYDLPTFQARPERLFRDYVRAHPEVAQPYAQLKRSLAERLGHDRAAYTEAKTDFIQSVVARALIQLNVTLEYALDAQGNLVLILTPPNRPASIYRFGEHSARFFQPMPAARAPNWRRCRRHLRAGVGSAFDQSGLWMADAIPFTRRLTHILSGKPKHTWVVSFNGEPVTWAWSAAKCSGGGTGGGDSAGSPAARLGAPSRRSGLCGVAVWPHAVLQPRPRQLGLGSFGASLS
jgi:hypothetical protein